MEFLRKMEKEVSCILEEYEQQLDLLEKEMKELNDRTMKLDISDSLVPALEDKWDELEDKYFQIEECLGHIEEALNPVEDALYTIETLVSEIEYEEKTSKMTPEERFKYFEEHLKKIREKREKEIL